MPTTTNLHRIKRAVADDYTDAPCTFSVVTVHCEAGSSVTLFFEPNKAQAVADAINAALAAPKVPA